MRLIDADALREGIACHKQYTDQEYATDRKWALGYNAGIERALFSIRYAHTIDAEPVRHGRWVFEFALDDSNFYRCSECNRQEVLLAKESINEWCPYCHCGAKMDGGAEDE